MGLSNVLFKGHVAYGCNKNSGPLHHELHLARSLACIPLLSMSAGFDACRHIPPLGWLCICLNFPDSVSNKRLEITASSSDPPQNVDAVTPESNFVHFYSKYVRILVVSRTPTIAPINSSLGTLVALFGETRVFAATMFVKKSTIAILASSVDYSPIRVFRCIYEGVQRPSFSNSTVIP